jgi:hypothetical protein
MEEPCPECGGLQLDMGRGRVRCLKHEGEPPRFTRTERVADGAAANGTAKRNGKATTARAKATTARAKAAPKKTTRAPAAKNGTTRNGSTTPRKPATRKAPASQA